MSWTPGSRVERIGSHTRTLVRDSLATQFQRDMTRLAACATETDSPPRVAANIERFGCRLLRQGAERLTDDLTSLVITQDGDVPDEATTWILGVVREVVETLARDIRRQVQQLSDQLDTLDSDAGWVGREERVVMRACEHRLEFLSVEAGTRSQRTTAGTTVG